MICNECSYYAGDGGDNFIRFITGHLPGCKNFKIEKDKFIDEFKSQLDLMYARSIVDVLNKKMEISKDIDPISSSSLIKKLFLKLSSTYYPIASNSYIYSWESDLLALNKESKYINEYEIKLSRQDFKADFKKEEKHKLLNDVFLNKKNENLVPNHFYYVITPGLLDKSEIPDYAGLIEVGKSISFRKKAPLLHKNKADDGFELQLLRKMYYKYWGNIK